MDPMMLLTIVCFVLVITLALTMIPLMVVINKRLQSLERQNSDALSRIRSIEDEFDAYKEAQTKSAQPEPELTEDQQKEVQKKITDILEADVSKYNKAFLNTLKEVMGDTPK